MLLTVLFYIFILTVVVQLSFYIFIFGKFTASKRVVFNHSSVPVSILIAAKNEAHNLKKGLPLILEQEYPTFEVILIDDASTDDTLEFLQTLQKEHKHLKLVSLANTINYKGNKKNAITRGIEAASYEHLLFTDADCEPKSNQWISEMIGHLSETRNIALGYGAYEKIERSLLNKLIRYETVLTAIQYFSYAKLGIPYMGVGRNLAYRKDLFIKNNGFSSHRHIKSGDDDLLISEIATSKNTGICFHKSSHTISIAKKNFKSWFSQKRRHISTATSYRPLHQFLLGLFFSTQFLFWVLAIILGSLAFNWQIVTILVAIRLTVHYVIVQNSAKKLDERDIVVFAPVLDFLLVCSQLGLFLTNIFSKPKHW